MFWTDKKDRFIMQFGAVSAVKMAAFIELHKNDIFTLDEDTDELKLITGSGRCNSRQAPVVPRIVSKKARAVLNEHFHFFGVDDTEALKLKYMHLVPKRVALVDTGWIATGKQTAQNVHNIKVTLQSKSDFSRNHSVF